MKQTASNKMTIEQLVELLMRARRRAEAASVEFYEQLIVAEVQHHDVWSWAGFTSFDRFLQATGIFDPARFVSYKVARNAIGSDRAQSLGVEAAIIASKQPAEVQSSLMTEVDRWSAHHNGALPSKETTRKLLNDIAPERRETQCARIDRRYEAVVAENAELKAELARSQKLVRELRAENDKLKKAAARAGGKSVASHAAE